MREQEKRRKRSLPTNKERSKNEGNRKKEIEEEMGDE